MGPVFYKDEKGLIHAASEIKPVTDKTNKVCNWNQYDDEYSAFEADCGGSFVMGDDVDDYDWLKFCCYCGKPAKVHPFEDNWDGPEDDREDIDRYHP